MLQILLLLLALADRGGHHEGRTAAACGRRMATIPMLRSSDPVGKGRPWRGSARRWKMTSSVRIGPTRGVLEQATPAESGRQGPTYQLGADGMRGASRARRATGPAVGTSGQAALGRSGQLGTRTDEAETSGRRRSRSAAQQLVQVLTGGRVAQLRHGPSFDLADPFTAEIEAGADLLEGAGLTPVEAEPQLDDLPHSELTTYANLDAINKMGINFITLRRRAAGLLTELEAAFPSAWRRIELKSMSRAYGMPKIYDRPRRAARLHRPDPPDRHHRAGT